MVLARIVNFCFKAGKREEGFSELDLILNLQARNFKGFRGFISLLSRDEKNSATILTLWADEESLIASEKEVMSKALDKIRLLLERKPDIEYYGVFSTELYMRHQ